MLCKTIFTSTVMSTLTYINSGTSPSKSAVRNFSLRFEEALFSRSKLATRGKTLTTVSSSPSSSSSASLTSRVAACDSVREVDEDVVVDDFELSTVAFEGDDAREYDGLRDVATEERCSHWLGELAI